MASKQTENTEIPDDVPSLDELEQLAEAGETGELDENLLASADVVDPADAEAIGGDEEVVIAGRDDTDDEKSEGKDEGEDDEKSESESKGDEGESESKGDGKGDEKPESKPDGILTRDGKHVIPFDVLKTTRDELAQAQAEAAELRAKLEQEAAAEAEKAATSEVEAKIAELQERVNKAKSEYDDEDVAEVVEPLQIAIDALERERELMQRTAAIEAQAQAQAATVEQDIQNAIDNSPAMSLWASEQGEMYQRATKLHDTLMATDPAYQAMSWDDRFKELPQKMAAIYSDVKLPDDTDTAVAKAKREAGRERKVATLSDMPAGEAPIVDKDNSLAAKSGVDLLDQFDGLTEEQIEAALLSG